MAKKANKRRLYKRLQDRQTQKKKYSLQDVQRAMNIAIEMKKLNRGHLYLKNNPTRCVFCGKKTSKTECKFWFITFMDRTQSVLLNPDFYTDKEIEAIWIQPELTDINIPIRMDGKI